MLSRFLKRKEPQPTAQPQAPGAGPQKIVIGVPGRWKSRDDITKAIASGSGGYFLADLMLVEVHSNKAWTLEVYERDPELRNAFEIAGRGQLDNALLAAIGTHTFTLYASTPDLSVESARGMQKVGCALLDSGGLAVKVESAGAAHSAAAWRDLAASEDPYDLMSAFLVVLASDEFYYTCGMHNLGLPDSSVSRSAENQEAVELLLRFNRYQLLAQQTLRDEDTYSLSEDSPWYRMSKVDDALNPPDSLFHNPFGRWHLSEAGES